MYYIVAGLFFSVACVLAAPAQTDVVPLEKQQPTVIPIVSQSEELESNGTYKFSYETGNGIKREEMSYDKKLPKGRAADSNEGGESNESDEIHVQIGSYSYTAPDGTLISVRYIADENGFQPIGDHIPRVPALGTSSSAEKLGRALNAEDSAGSGSAPAPSKSQQKPEALQAVPESEGSGDQVLIPSVEAKSAETSMNVASTSEVSAESSTTEAAADTSTTEAAERSTTAATMTTEVADASTTEAVKTTEASSELVKTTEAVDASTIEAANTTEASSEAAKTTEAADASTTETGNTTQASSETAKTTEAADSSTTEAAKTSEASSEVSSTESASNEASTTEAASTAAPAA